MRKAGHATRTRNSYEYNTLVGKPARRDLLGSSVHVHLHRRITAQPNSKGEDVNSGYGKMGDPLKMAMSLRVP